MTSVEADTELILNHPNAMHVSGPVDLLLTLYPYLLFSPPKIASGNTIPAGSNSVGIGNIVATGMLLRHPSFLQIRTGKILVQRNHSIMVDTGSEVFN